MSDDLEQTARELVGAFYESPFTTTIGGEQIIQLITRALNAVREADAQVAERHMRSSYGGLRNDLTLFDKSMNATLMDIAAGIRRQGGT